MESMGIWWFPQFSTEIHILEFYFATCLSKTLKHMASPLPQHPLSFKLKLLKSTQNSANMDSIPIHTSLVPNEKIRCNCHRIHKRSSQHRSCVLRLYFTCLTKKSHGTSSEIQHPTCQTTRDQKALKVISKTKRALHLQWFQIGHSNNRRN